MPPVRSTAHLPPTAESERHAERHAMRALVSLPALFLHQLAKVPPHPIQERSEVGGCPWSNGRRAAASCLWILLLVDGHLGAR